MIGRVRGQCAGSDRAVQRTNASQSRQKGSCSFLVCKLIDSVLVRLQRPRAVFCSSTKHTA